jgi:hypothetical protein
VTSVAQDNINELFLKLYQWRNIKSWANKKKSLDQLAIISLEIASILLDSPPILKSIATQLSIIYDCKKIPPIHAELLDSLQVIESKLEANLRGFSFLLDAVLEEEIIQRDPVYLLKKVPGVDDLIVDCFNQLSLLIEAYLDLNEVFVLNDPKLATVIFLLSLSAIYEALIRPKKCLSQMVINDWLATHVKNKHIQYLYDSSLKIISLPNIGGLVLNQERDLLIIFLCFKVARCQPIRMTEAKKLDKALESVGMLGLKPLLESGFLVLEKLYGNEHLIESNHAKILRVK